MIEAGLDAVERRKVVDKVAAAIMLQSWLDGREARAARDAREARQARQARDGGPR
jgi:putative Holliday junction resolvase